MVDGTTIDEAFDTAFGHLAACRIAWEDDPRDPARFAELGRARAALEDARSAMRAERGRLGVEPPRRGSPLPPHHLDQRADWQGIHPT